MRRRAFNGIGFRKLRVWSCRSALNLLFPARILTIPTLSTLHTFHTFRMPEDFSFKIRYSLFDIHHSPVGRYPSFNGTGSLRLHIVKLIALFVSGVLILLLMEQGL